MATLGAGLCWALVASATFPGPPTASAAGISDAVRAPLSPAQDPADAFRACLRREMGDRIIGAAAGVAVEGRVVMAEGFGLRRKDGNDAVDADTQFRIGSSTKMLTAAGLLRLVDQGRVDLDAPLSRYLPDLRFAQPGVEDRVRVRDLLQHTSGLPDNSVTGEADLYGKPDEDAMRRWVLAQGATRPHNPPGRFWNYSSANYMYAGQIIERVSGLSFQRYMRQELFDPAGMHDSTMVASEVEARGNFALGHWNDIFRGGLAIWKPSDQDNWARHPTGYAHSTVGDLLRFAELLMAEGGGLLSPRSARLMTSPLVYVDQRADQYYGFGVFSERHQSLEIKRHPGSAWGWMATVDWVPARRFAVVTLTNGFGALYGSADCAIDAFLKPAAAPLPGGSCPQRRDRWPAFAGHYEGHSYVGKAMSYDLSFADGTLFLSGTRSDGQPFRSAMAQDCALAYNQGPGGFQVDLDGNGAVDTTVTLIADPVEPGVVWMRHRQFVLREPGEAPTLEPTPSPQQSPTPGPGRSGVYLPMAQAGS